MIVWGVCSDRAVAASYPRVESAEGCSWVALHEPVAKRGVSCLRVTVESGGGGVAIGLAEMPQPTDRPLWSGGVWRLHLEDGFVFAAGEHCPPLDDWVAPGDGDTVELAFDADARTLVVRMNGAAAMGVCGDVAAAAGRELHFVVEVSEGSVVSVCPAEDRVSQ